MASKKYPLDLTADGDDILDAFEKYELERDNIYNDITNISDIVMPSNDSPPANPIDNQMYFNWNDHVVQTWNDSGNDWEDKAYLIESIGSGLSFNDTLGSLEIDFSVFNTDGDSSGNDISNNDTPIENSLGLINYGLTIEKSSGFAAKINAGQCTMNGIPHSFNDTDFTFDSQTPALAIIKKSDSDFLLSKVNGKYPNVNSTILLRYTFDEDTPQDSSTGGTNHMTVSTMTDISKVDSWLGYGGRGNGRTSTMTSANATNFPTDASVRTVNILIRPHRLKGEQYYVAFSNTAGKRFDIRTSTKRLKVYLNGTDYDTGYDLQINKTYIISAVYDGAIVRIYVNGKFILDITIILATDNLIPVRFLAYTASIGFAFATIGYFDIRNDDMTSEEIAAMVNQILIPCRHNTYVSDYPTITVQPGDLSSDYHVYKYNDTGSTLADDVGGQTGTIHGTASVDSTLGLSKARQFNGTSTDFIDLSNYAFPSSFTIIHMGNRRTRGNYPILSNRAAGNGGNMLYIDSSGYLKLMAGTTTMASSTSLVPLKQTSFIAAVVDNDASQATFYVGSPIADDPAVFTPSVVNNVLYIGKDTVSVLYDKGIHEYTAIIPYAMDDIEISQAFDKLTKQVQLSLLDSVKDDIGTRNFITLGFVRTDSSGVIQIDDTSYKYLRNDGKNKKVFLGWRYWKLKTSDGNPIMQYLTWDNPLGVTNYNVYVVFGKTMNAELQTQIQDQRCTINYIGSDRVQIGVSSNVAYCFGAWQNEGYIGVYVEVA